jgi:hypothetical protein
LVLGITCQPLSWGNNGLVITGRIFTLLQLYPQPLTTTSSLMTTAPCRLVCKKLHYPPGETVGARKHLFRQALTQLFEPLHATEIFVPDHKNKNYAFVSFPTTSSAEQALAAISLPHLLFDELKDATSVRSPRVKPERLSPHEKQQKDTIRRLKDIMETAYIDFILQCTKSHVDRIQELLTGLDGERTVQMKGIHHIKDVSLLFCQAPHPHMVVNYLHSKWYIQDNLQRIFIVRNASGERPETASSTPLFSSRMFEARDIAGLLVPAVESYDSGGSICRIRVQVYPPRIHAQVLERLEDVISKSKCLAICCACTPDRTTATHTLSVLELVPPSESNADNGFYILACTLQTTPTTTKASPPMVGHATCRAYWKLAEALARYRYTPPSLSGAHGMDVGASPGGWTQYLIQSQGLAQVYSIDPGDLDSFVLGLQGFEMCENGKRKNVPAVRHIRATYPSGIPQVAQDRRNVLNNTMIMVQHRVHWFVSDMCVKTLGEQVDALLLAVQQALVISGTFIVLTLKCTRGHSKTTFDALVEEQVDRIRPRITNLHVLHLFSNRSSERTIMGYWN